MDGKGQSSPLMQRPDPTALPSCPPTLKRLHRLCCVEPRRTSARHAAKTATLQAKGCRRHSPNQLPLPACLSSTPATFAFLSAYPLRITAWEGRWGGTLWVPTDTGFPADSGRPADFIFGSCSSSVGLPESAGVSPFGADGGTEGGWAGLTAVGPFQALMWLGWTPSS